MTTPYQDAPQQYPTPPVQAQPVQPVQPVQGQPLPVAQPVQRSIVIEDDTPQDNRIQVRLIGQDYSIRPPKSALALKLAVRAKGAEDDPSLLMPTLEEWLRMAMGADQSQQVLSRLSDPEDNLDVLHVMRLMEKVMEVQTGNPTS